MRVENLRVRLNGDDNSDLLGWVECVVTDGEHKFYLNNIRVKRIPCTDGSTRPREEYPAKVVTVNGLEKKVFYVKPIDTASYLLVHKEIINFLKGGVK